MGPAAACRGSSWSINSAAAQGRSITACFRKLLFRLGVQSTVLGVRPAAAQGRRFWAMGPAATCRGSSLSISSAVAQGRSIWACFRKRLFDLGVHSISYGTSPSRRRGQDSWERCVEVIVYVELGVVVAGGHRA
jgi:hypothetical protein